MKNGKDNDKEFQVDDNITTYPHGSNIACNDKYSTYNKMFWR